MDNIFQQKLKKEQKIDADAIPSDIVIIVNDIASIKKNDIEIEMANLDYLSRDRWKGKGIQPSFSDTTTSPLSETIQQRLDSINSDNQFIIKNRTKNKFGQDDFEILLENMDFCKITMLPLQYSRELNDSDFVIFINDTRYISEGNPYKPMCIAIIKCYDKRISPFLYISIFCSNEKYGKCAMRLMNMIKYIGKQLNYEQIRLQSVHTQHTLQFYKKSGFINLFEDSVLYSHYYTITDDDAQYKYLPPIQGMATIVVPKKNKSTRRNMISQGFSRKKTIKRSNSSRNKTWKTVSSKRRKSI